MYILLQERNPKTAAGGPRALNKPWACAPRALHTPTSEEILILLLLRDRDVVAAEDLTDVVDVGASTSEVLDLG